MRIGTTHSATLALWTFRILWGFGVVWIPSLHLHFVYRLCRRVEIKVIRFHYIVAGFFFLFWWSPWIYSGVRWCFNSFYYITAGLLFPAFIIWWWALTVYVHFILYQTMQQVDLEEKNRLRYCSVSTAIAYGGAAFTYLPAFKIDVYPWGNYAIVVYPLIMTYAILRHRLLDINIVFRKTLVYSAATLSLTAVYVAVLVLITKLFEGWSGRSTIYSSAIAAASIAILFHPVRSRIQQWIDKNFPQESLNQNMLREATGRFVHEIKRPLANISMPAQLALMDLESTMSNPEELHRLAPKLHERLKYIVDESLKVGRKIEAIRDVSSTQSALQQDVIDLKKLVTSLIQQEQSRIEQAKIDLEISNPNIELLTLGNTAQIEVAIANALKNAIDALSREDYSEAKHIGIQLAQEGESILLEIKDSGPGIAPQDLSHLFDPWFTTKGSSGMGIGLYLTKEILRSHGSRIEVKSRPGSTTFRIVFRSRTNPV